MARKTPPSVDLDELKINLDELKISPEVGWYLESRGIPFPDVPPAWKTPEPRRVRGAAFDPERVDAVLRSFGALRHTKGKWAGKPLKPDPWQVAYFLAPVFGWVKPDPDDRSRMVRIIRKAYLEVPRKNGKTTIIGGIGVHLTGGDGEPGAEVIAAATTKDQAGFVFQPIKSLVTATPALRRHFRPVGFKVIHPKSSSYLQAISSVADAQQGANIHGGLIDELHVHKSPAMVNVIETGTGARSQPLIVIITTADERQIGSIYDERRTKIEQLAQGVIREPGQYGVIWCADEHDDPFVEETWRKANPGYGISPTKAYMQAAAESARNTPSELPTFKRLHLGIRIKELTRWISLSAYDVTGQTITDDEWRGKKVHAGLDLSSTSDFTAYVVRARDPEKGHLVRMLCWLPEERVGELEQQLGVPLRQWVDSGFVRLTEGNVVDYEKVRADILADRTALGYKIDTLAYDPWNATETVTKLEDAGVNMVPVKQGYANLSAPTKALERLILGSTPKAPLVRTGGNPVLRWMVDCTEVRTDDNGNVKPVKPDRAKTSKRIDGVVAWIMAEREDMADADKKHPGAQYLAGITTKCPACGHVNPKSAQHCTKCQSELTAAS